MTIVRRPGATTRVRQLGAATMIARCAAPSSARAARNSGTGGSTISNADSAAAAARPRTRLLRNPMRSTDQAGRSAEDDADHADRRQQPAGEGRRGAVVRAQARRRRPRPWRTASRRRRRTATTRRPTANRSAADRRGGGRRGGRRRDGLSHRADPSRSRGGRRSADRRLTPRSFACRNRAQTGRTENEPTENQRHCRRIERHRLRRRRGLGGARRESRADQPRRRPRRGGGAQDRRRRGRAGARSRRAADDRRTSSPASLRSTIWRSRRSSAIATASRTTTSPARCGWRRSSWSVTSK